MHGRQFDVIHIVNARRNLRHQHVDNSKSKLHATASNVLCCILGQLKKISSCRGEAPGATGSICCGVEASAALLLLRTSRARSRSSTSISLKFSAATRTLCCGGWGAALSSLLLQQGLTPFFAGFKLSSLLPPQHTRCATTARLPQSKRSQELVPNRQPWDTFHSLHSFCLSARVAHAPRGQAYDFSRGIAGLTAAKLL